MKNKTIIIGAIIFLIFASMSAISYLFWEITDRDKKLALKDMRIMQDSLQIASQERELEKMEIAYGKIKEAYKILNIAYNELSTRVESLESKNDSLEKQMTDLNNAVRGIAQNKPGKKSTYPTETKTSTAPPTKTDPSSPVASASTERKRSAYGNSNNLANTYIAVPQNSAKKKEANIFNAKNISVMDETPETGDGKKKLFLKIAFQLSGINDMAEEDKKDIFIKIVKPDGNAFYSPGSGGGKFKVGKKEEIYTAKIPVVLEQSDINISFDFKSSGYREMGTYLLEVYDENSLLGTQEFLIP